MKKTLLILLFLLFSSNCAIGPTHGLFLFTSTKFPGEYNPANDVQAVKSAEGCSHSILYLFGFGNSGAGQIAKDNKILRIATIDHSTFSIFSIVYRNYCTIVSGE
ncbi:MAG: TRL-like family protein [Leptospiraceae bacterium]|nr:TRL-like family protein [Leptospiraceae bacterium]